ncbi:MAG: T9SS type A sorting domain-containing protein [Reichenbachiella sp.]
MQKFYSPFLKTNLTIVFCLVLISNCFGICPTGTNIFTAGTIDPGCNTNEAGNNLTLWAAITVPNGVTWTITAGTFGIGFGECNGTINETRSYGFIDYEFIESAYYRLKQVDFDGQFEYCEIIAVEQRSSEKVEIYPNPIVEGQISIGGPSTNTFDAYLISISSKEIIKMTGTLSELEKELNYNLSSIEPSAYLLKTTSRIETQTIRFIKKMNVWTSKAS